MTESYHVTSLSSTSQKSAHSTRQIYYLHAHTGKKIPRRNSLLDYIIIMRNIKDKHRNNDSDLQLVNIRMNKLMHRDN